MKIQYQKIENGLEILRIWQDSGIIKVPEQIEGIPVIRIAPYTFSLHKDEEGLQCLYVPLREAL